MTTLNWDMKTLFLYLQNATICIDQKSRNIVFNNMAYKLIEWENASRCEVRKVLDDMDIKFEECCSECNERLIDYEDDEEEPKCEECKKSSTLLQNNTPIS